jgi:alkaline phosphatase
MACGFKTTNGRIASLPDKTPCKTILEAARDKGLATGLVATSSITHATPASFAAHVESRNMEREIAKQLIQTKPEVLIGGGRKYFKSSPNPITKAFDHTSTLKVAADKGYRIANTPAELRNATEPYLLALLQPGPLTTEPPEPNLAELTEKSLQILNQDPDGFFLMVEGSQIDWACHKNDAEETARQTLLFDQAVKKALQFAARNPRTLIIVTSDHETGDLTVNKQTGSKATIKADFSSLGHTTRPVPLFAAGPGADRFNGNLQNTDIPRLIAQIAEIEDFPAVMSMHSKRDETGHILQLCP